MKFTRFLFYILPALIFVNLSAQDKKLVDGIVATVGEEVVLQSDVEDQITQMRMQGVYVTSRYYCEVMRKILVQKLMVNQAELDSIVVSEDQISMQIDQRIDYFVSGLGSEEKLEKEFNKSVTEIKQDMRPLIRDQMLGQQIRSGILSNITVTPAEVRDYYNNSPKDSIPWVNNQVKLAQIVVYPELDKDEEFRIKEKLLGLRKRIIAGESFSTLAVLYSEGPSASKKGELGFMAKGELAPEYAEAAFKLKEPGSVSNIVKTDFGYHIIQLIEKRNNKVNTRHIIIKPKYSPEAIVNAKNQLDSLLTEIRTNDTISFDMAAKLFSQDRETAINGGVMLNPMTNSNFFEPSELNSQDYYMAKTLKPGQISDPYESSDKTGKKIFKIVKVLEVIEPHRADLKRDYNLIAEKVKVSKQQKVISEWIEDKISSTYIEISPEYKKCKNLDNWFQENKE